jgi:membrane protease YdiL (CAAX protease family)
MHIIDKSIAMVVGNSNGLKITDFGIALFCCLVALMVFLTPDKAFVLNRILSSVIVVAYSLTVLLSIRFASTGGAFYWWDFVILGIIYAGMLDLFPSVSLISQPNLINFELIYRILLIILFWYYLCFRKISINFSLNIGFKSLFITLGITFVFVLINIYIVQKLNFLQLSPCTADWKTIFIIAVYMIFVVSLAEEFFMRGLLYGYLQQFLPRYGIPLILSSMIFGLGHIFFAGWPMVVIATIAGFCYCLVYQLTGNNINCAIISHTLTNLVWWLFTK